MKPTEIINGVDVNRLAKTIDDINIDPELATFRFQVSNTWDNGGHNQTSIKRFYGAKRQIDHEVPFRIEADEPPILLGGDQGANPVEYLLTALAGCLTTTLVYHAAARGIIIRSVESELDGELDLRGFLGLSDKVRKGYKNIRVRFSIDSDAPQDVLETLTVVAQRHSPVFDMLSNPVDISVSAQRIVKTTH